MPLQHGFAPIQDGNIRAEFLHRGHLVAGHDDILPLFHFPADDLLKQFRVHRVQAGEGLVQHNQLRVGNQCRHQLNLLLVALGKLVRLQGLAHQFADWLSRRRGAPPLFQRQIQPAGLFGGIQIFLHRQIPRQFADAPTGHIPGHAPQRGEIHQLVHQRIFGIQPPLLRQIPHVAIGRSQFLAVPEHLSPVPGQHAQYHSDRRGFARAIGAQQRVYPALMHFKGKVIHHLFFAVIFRQSGNLQTHVHRSLFSIFLFCIHYSLPCRRGSTPYFLCSHFLQISHRNFARCPLSRGFLL